MTTRDRYDLAAEKGTRTRSVLSSGRSFRPHFRASLPKEPAIRVSRRVRRALVPLAIPLVAWALRLLGWSWRVRIEGPDPQQTEAFRNGASALAAVWHRNILIGAAVYRDAGYSVPISRSRDGDLIAAVIARLGWSPPPRGSSSRGATRVLRQAIAQVQEGTTMAVLCDGPRGPARKLKPGIVVIAGDTGVPITPVAYAARPCSRFPSWDRTLLPWPFARVVIRYGEPFSVEIGLDDDARLSAARALEDRLNALTDALDAEIGTPVS